MKNFELPQEKIEELRFAHKSVKNKSEAYKINAVILLGNGWSLGEVSEALLFDSETIRSYANKYKSCGLSGLLKTNYKGSKPKLSDEQLSKLCDELDNNVYLATKDICEYVKSSFNITYSVSGMTDLLKRLDFVYKKPKLVPGNPDKEEQQIFIRQYLEFMETKKNDEAVFFIDAVHPTHNAQAAYGWIRKGKDKEVKTNSGRDRLNIHGAMNAETFETTTITTEDSIDTHTTIELLKSLEIIYYWATTIYVIMDNAKYHFSWQVLAYVAKSRIKMVPLPTYSPELNLIERLWKIFKKKIMYNKYYETFDDFKKACKNFFKKQDGYIDEIRSIMGDGLESLAI